MNVINNIKQKWFNWRVSLHRKHYLLGASMHIVSIVIAAFILVFIFTISMMQPYRVHMSSMYPTLNSGDRLFILRTGKIVSGILGQDHVPRRGEIIVFHSTVNDGKWIKRVIGLPGERITIKDNRITIYNQEYPEGFEPKFNLNPQPLDFPPGEPEIDRIIKQGEVFVLGDNRPASDDSRGRLGNISVNDIDGTAIIRVVPITSFSFF